MLLAAVWAAEALPCACRSRPRRAPACSCCRCCHCWWLLLGNPLALPFALLASHPQAPEESYSVFMLLGNDKLPLAAGLGHVNFYMCQVGVAGTAGRVGRDGARRALQHRLEGQRSPSHARLPCGCVAAQLRDREVPPGQREVAAARPPPPRPQFPFDYRRPARPGATKAFATYDYVILNSEFTDRCIG